MEYKEYHGVKEKKEIFETSVKPELPEQPLIYVRKKREAEYYEALFALELAGITNRRLNHHP